MVEMEERYDIWNEYVVEIPSYSHFKEEMGLEKILEVKNEKHNNKL